MRTAIFVFLLACGTAPKTTLPASALEPASDAVVDVSAYVKTPAGYYHESCVFDAGENASVSLDARITRADGSTQTLSPCAYPHYSANMLKEPTTKGWIAYASWTSATPATKMTASFNVPGSPNAASGELDYFFPGMQPQGVPIILQPVLAFGKGPAGGGQSDWGIASWSCGSNCVHSAYQNVGAGDSLYGSITGANCASTGACDWTITTTDLTNGASTTLNTSDDPNAYVWLVSGVLESYGVNDCTQYPTSNANFTGVDFFDINGALLTPSYGDIIADKTTCPSVQVQSSSTSATISFQ